jgi:lipoprotein NlpD
MRGDAQTCIKLNNEVSVKSNTQLKTFSTTALVVFALVLGGCTSNTSAPVSNLSSGTPSVSTYVVKPGDTLNKISRATGVPEGTIARMNKITNPNLLIVGQTLRLSEGKSAAPVVRPGTGASSQASQSSQSSQSAQSSSASNNTEAGSTRASDAGLISWGWPAKGKIIQGFTPATKGIDIAGNSGDPIESAANGKVIFAGDGPRGLGNLVIIEHTDGFITAYAHNKTLLVKEGQVVKRGTKIAEMGQSDTTSVRLHFEVRRRGTPVDPLQYLPAR